MVTTAMQEFSVKAECEFTKEADQVECNLKEITESGIALKAARGHGGSHARKIEHLKECIPKTSSCI